MSFLFNPYRKIAGSKALMIGFAIAVITLIIAPISYAVFNGVLDYHRIHYENWWVYSTFYFISWIAIVLTFGAAAFLFSKSNFRWIDILGTTLLAKAPLLILAIMTFYIPETQLKDPNNIAAFDFGIMVIIALIIITLGMIWMIALLFNAYSVSLNIKGNKLIWSFILTLLTSEILSKLILHYLSPFLK